MSSPVTSDTGRLKARGLATLLAFVGLFLLNGAPAWSTPSLAGIAVVLVGFGLWKYQRWARWLAMGLCFLAVAMACVGPVLVFLSRGDELFTKNLVLSGFLMGCGLLGYFGLGYLRSEHGRHEFAADPQTLERLLAERSSAVAYSAGVWLLFFVLMPLLMNARMPHPSGSQRIAPPASSATPTRYVVLREPMQIGHSFTPDLIPLGLCYRDHMRQRVIHVVYTNVGGRAQRESFHFASGRDLDSPLTLHAGLHPTPKRKQLATAEYGLESSAMRGKLYVGLDVGNAVHESDESNNVAEFEFLRARDGTLTLPQCDNVELQVFAHDGPTVSTATVIPPQSLPDLVPLGLCQRGPYFISMQFTNRGAEARGHIWIAQGSSLQDLEVKENVYHPVPGTGEARGFSVGSSAADPGESRVREIMVQLDAHDQLHESNELNNIVSARVTYGADGRVDLPDCDAIARHATELDWIADSVALQPAFVTLPDLVPLGLCVKDWGADSQFIQAIIGNLGTVRSPLEFRIEVPGAPVRRSSPQHIPEFRVPSPDYLMLAETGLHAADARDRETLAIDSTNVIVESHEANNAVQFDLRRDAEGKLLLPDCETIRGRVSEWDGKMQSITGPE